MDEQVKILLRNSSWTLISQSIVIVSSYFRIILIARELGPDLFGLYSIITVFILNFQQFLDLNLSQSLIKFCSEYKELNQNNKIIAFTKGSFFVGLFSIFLFIPANIFIFFFTQIIDNNFSNKYELKIGILIFIVGSSFRLLDFLGGGLLKLNLRFKIISRIEIITVLLELAIITTITVLFEKKIDVLFIGISSVIVLKSILLFVTAYKIINIELKEYVNVSLKVLKNELKKITSFTISNSLGRTIKTLTYTGDILILSVFASTLQVGYYSAAKKVALSIAVITQPMLSTIYPQLTNLVSKNKYQEIKILLKKITIPSVLVALPVFIFILLFRNQIITLILGKEYISASNVLVTLLFVGVLRAIFFWPTALILSLGLAKYRLLMNLIALLSGIICAFEFAPAYGGIGIAFSLVTAQIISEVGLIIIAQKTIKKRSKIILTN